VVRDLLQQASRPGADEAFVRTCLEAALRAANDRIWVPRNVARLYREALGDAASARRVLGELAPLTCLEWRLAAAAWIELEEVAVATSYLERAAGNARTAADLCTVALGYRDAGFFDEGRLLASGAERLAVRAIDCWTVATTHEVLGGGGVAVLEAGLRDATEVPEIVTFVHALATFDVEAAVLRGAVEAGERRASTVRDWVELALTQHQILLDDEASLRCLAAASSLATSPDDERAIAVASARVHELELLDDDRPKLPPAQLLRPGARSFGWDREPARLLGWLRARLPRTSIDALTRTGDFFVNDGLVALLEVSKTGHLPHPIPAYLDALRVVRWEPEVDHLTRAFACTLLCIEDAALTVPDGSAAQLAVLLDSCIALGPGAVEGALALFAAMADAYDATQSTTLLRPMTLIAELGMVLAAAWLDPTDPRLEHLIARLVTDEARYRIAQPLAMPDWLLGLARTHHRDELWRSLAAAILVHPRHAALAARLR
jgi:hypothetical protein